MRKPATPTKKSKLRGLPRTAAAARKHKSKVEIHFDKMSEAERKKWIHIAPPKSKSNDIALIRPRASSIPKSNITRYTVTQAGDDTFIVCYYSASGVPDDCHEISAAQLAAMKPSGK